MSNFIPEYWKYSPLGEYLNLKTGFSYKSQDFSEEGAVPVLRIANIKENGINLDNAVFVSHEIANNTSRYSVKEYNIVIAMSGATTGKTGQVNKENLPLLLNQRVGTFDIKNENELSNNFLKFLVQMNSFRNLINIDAVGGAQPNISSKQIESIHALIPPIKEQQKIAAILTSVDDAIEKTEAIIKQTEKVKKGLMQQLLTKGIGHTKFKQTEIGEIPEGWDLKKVKDIARVIRGASPRPKGDPKYYGGNIPRLMVADVTRDKKYITPKIDFLTDEGAKLSRPMKAGSLVVVCSGTVGVPGILKVDACIHDGFLGISEISNECTEEYLFYSFTLLKSKFHSSATHGGIFTNLTTNIMKDFLITIPPIIEQKKIIQILNNIDQKIFYEENKLQQFLNLKQSLMQVLLTGKVRVKVDEWEAAK